MNKDNNQKSTYKELRNKIEDHFSLGELKALCYDLSVNFEDLSGDTKPEKIIQLIEYMVRRGILNDLSDVLKVHRPNVNWDLYINDEQLGEIQFVKLISKTRLKDDRTSHIHSTKHIAEKIDMAGISLSDFLSEIVNDPNQEMVKRLIEKEIRLRVIIVHPDAQYLKQREIEDDDGADLQEMQKRSVEICLTFYRKLIAFCESKSVEEPKGRFLIKLTKFCPYLSIERYDTDIYWGLYTSDKPGKFSPNFIASFEDNEIVFNKLRNHFSSLFERNFNGEQQNDLTLIKMQGRIPKLNIKLAEDILGKQKVKEVLGDQ